MNRFLTITKKYLMILAVLAVLMTAGTMTAEAAVSNIIVIGDSRTQDMHSAVGDSGVSWIYSVGMGYDWMVSTAVPAAEPYITDGTAVVIILGVNDVMDPFIISSYSSYLNQKSEKWRKLGAVLYYVSITPVDDELDHYEHNVDIENWNNTIASQLNSDVIYLDIYTALGQNYTTVDGLHYNYETSRNIFDLVIAGVNAYQNTSIVFEAQEIEEDDSLVPHMTMTAADTEEVAAFFEESYFWKNENGVLKCLDEAGNPVTGIKVIGKMVCVLNSDGELQFSFRK